MRTRTEDEKVIQESYMRLRHWHVRLRHWVGSSTHFQLGTYLKLYCTVMLLLIQAAYSQIFNIRGNVSTGTTPVKYASITFTDQNDTTKKFTTITDALGNYHVSVLTGVDDKKLTLPSTIELAQNYPNPFSSSTAISYQLNKQVNVNVAIYDILGRQVKRFSVGLQTAGVHGVIWDGKNDFGEKVAIGVYFYRLQVKGEIQVKKMVFTGGSIAVPLSLITNSFTPTSRLKKNKILTSSTAYTVHVKNTDSTKPFIMPIKIDDFTVKDDTTIDFIAEQFGTWSKLESGETNWVRDIDFVDDKNGWAVGDSGVILQTKNGGDSWQRQIFPWEELPGLHEYEERMQAVTFLDSSFGWICSRNSILKTTDRGENWKITYNEDLKSGYFREIGFLNSNIGFVVGGKGDFGSVGFILKTDDGGETWRNITPRSLPTLTHISIVDEQNIWACGHSGTVILTTDVGLTWSDKSLSGIPFSPYLTCIQFIDQHNGWISADDNSVGFNFFRTTNAGTTWIYTSRNSEMLYLLGVESFHFVDSLHGWLAILPGIGKYAIYQTNDGGETWHPQPEEMNIGQIYAFCFLNKNSGWAVGIRAVNHKAEGVILRYSRIPNNP